MKKSHLIILALALTASLGAGAQNAKNNSANEKPKQLTKEITLEKDFVPVERKVEKKNTLPQVQKALTKEQVALKYSDWAVPAPVPASVPTMMPYGYRTAHHFSDHRGYLDAGAGSQASIVLSAGYRIVDNITTQLGVWLQHNSTWGGRNNTTALAAAADRLTQKFNQNKLGIDFVNRFSSGTLRLNARAELDRFNYYGAFSSLTDFYTTDPLGQEWEDHTQNYHHVGVGASWSGEIALRDNDFNYRIGIKFAHSGFGRSEATESPEAVPSPQFKHTKTTGKDLSAFVGADYALTDNSKVGADLEFRRIDETKEVWTGNLQNKLNRFNFTPFYEYVSGNVSSHFGAKLMLFSGDGTKKFRVAPDVRFAINLAGGATLYGNVTGGVKVYSISELHEMNRYNSPLGLFPYTYSPLDIEAGFKVGEFYGFTLKVFGGYGVANANLWSFVPLTHQVNAAGVVYPDFSPADDSHRVRIAAAGRYSALDTRGVKVGGELSFKYRSYVDFSARALFAPQKSSLADNGDYKALLLDVDAPKYIVNLDLKVNPIRRLSVGVGCDFKGGRRFLAPHPDSPSTITIIPMDNIINLRAGASYRLLDKLTLWAQASNLLNRRWDVLPYMAAQKLNVMGGVALVF